MLCIPYSAESLNFHFDHHSSLSPCLISDEKSAAEEQSTGGHLKGQHYLQSLILSCSYVEVTFPGFAKLEVAPPKCLSLSMHYQGRPVIDLDLFTRPILAAESPKSEAPPDVVRDILLYKATRMHEAGVPGADTVSLAILHSRDMHDPDSASPRLIHIFRILTHDNINPRISLTTAMRHHPFSPFILQELQSRSASLPNDNLG